MDPGATRQARARTRHAWPDRLLRRRWRMAIAARCDLLRNRSVRGLLWSAMLLLSGAAAAVPPPLLNCGQIPYSWAGFGGAQIDIKNNVTVNGNPVANGKTLANSAVLPDGTRQTISPAPTLPALEPPIFPANASTSDVVVPDNGSQTLNAGAATFYRDITVGKNATLSLTGGGPFHIQTLTVKKGGVLNLAAGTYFIDKLTLEDNTTLNATSEPVLLHIGNKAKFKKNVTVNASSVTGLRVFLHTMAELKTKKDFNFTGLIYGPNAKKVDIDDNATFHGTIVTAGDVKIGKNSVITYSAADQSSVATDLALVAACPVLAAYHLDEAAWTGAAGEVIDSSGNGRHGTALGGITTANANPAIGGSPGTCGYGVVPGNTTVSPVQAVDTGLNVKTELGDRFTIGFWYNFQDLAGTTNWHTLFDATPPGTNTFFLMAYTSAPPSFPPSILFLARNSSGFVVKVISIPTFTTGSWHYLTISYDAATAGRLRLYLDAAMQPEQSVPFAIWPSTSQNLVFGDGVSGNSFFSTSADGLIDEIRIYQRELTQPEILADMQVTRPCGAALDHFKIVHDGFGINCAAESIQISARDASDAVLSTYTGTATIDTGSGKGDWSLSTGNGTLNNGVANDGQATYTFAAADNGVATLALDYREGASPITLSLTDGTATDDGSHGPLAFSPSGFTVTANALANPPPNPINDPIANQTAGSNYALHLTAFGQTPTDPVCGVIESYTGVKTPKFWSSYLDPNSGSVQATIDTTPIATTEGAAATQNVTFTLGQAQVTAKYKDVGRIQIELKDDTVADPNLPTGIRGATTPFVVKPDHFLLSGIQRTSDSFANPGAANANGAAFIQAGAPFTATVTAYDAESTVTPNYGQESAAEGVRLTPTLVLPSPGANPAIASSFNAFSAGSATGTTFSWGEVGIITLTPAVGDTDYLGAGDVSGQVSGNVGRFTPFDFDAVPTGTPVFGATCGAFSYMDQPFHYTTAPVITVTARNQSGATTTNYSGAFWKFTDAKLLSAGNKTYTALTGALDLAGLPVTPDPVIADTGSGAGTLTFSDGLGLSFMRMAPVVPFNAEIALSIKVIDTDDIVYGSNPFSFGAASAGNGIAFSGGNKEQRFGRLRLINAVGSELLPLSVPMRTEYFKGGGFVTNSDDGCTAIDTSLISLTNGNPPTGPGPGVPTIAIGGGTTTASIANNPMLSGDAGLTFSAPGAGNTGYADLTFNLATRLWLRFDWDGNGNQDNDPSARATFGIYTGNPHLIFSHEPWN